MLQLPILLAYIVLVLGVFVGGAVAFMTYSRFCCMDWLETEQQYQESCVVVLLRGEKNRQMKSSLRIFSVVFHPTCPDLFSHAAQPDMNRQDRILAHWFSQVL